MDQSLPAPVELRLDTRADGAKIAWVIIRNEAKLNVLNTRVLQALIGTFARLREKRRGAACRRPHRRRHAGLHRRRRHRRDGGAR